MPTEYTQLVSALKALTIIDGQDSRTLPMAENEWNTRPDADSYGIVALEFEADALHGDNRKVCTAYEGSVDLFSRDKRGGGWRPLIEAALQAHCGACWSLNSYQYERETGLGHWEWTFQTTDEEAGDE